MMKRCIMLFKELRSRFKMLLNSTTAECKIPDNLLREFAKCLLPDIVTFCESDTGKQLFEEWKLKRKLNKMLNLEKSKSKAQ